MKRPLPSSDSNLRWRFSKLDITVPDGWNRIVDVVLRKLRNVGLTADHLENIKEKYGELRIEWSGDTSLDWIEELLEWARSEAARTCMTCGSKGGKRRERGWITVTCAKCAGT